MGRGVTARKRRWRRKWVGLGAGAGRSDSFPYFERIWVK